MAAFPPGRASARPEMISPLGEGGMGEVYRAHDAKLHRQVALKILPAFVTDTERKARFEREARILAALSHPHIAQIYGLEENALVMELVEGDNLSAIVRARRPAARRSAGDCDANRPGPRRCARPRHRPSQSGQRQSPRRRRRQSSRLRACKGGRYARRRAPSSDNSPTVTSPAMTKHGVLLGTAAYMSPEQARGKPIDKRTDLWAFGCVLFEMLTGRRAFDPGDTISDAVAAVLKNEPDWTALPPSTPAASPRLVEALPDQGSPASPSRHGRRSDSPSRMCSRTPIPRQLRPSRRAHHARHGSPRCPGQSPSSRWPRRSPSGC